VVDGELEPLGTDERARLGIASLPVSLAAALDAIENDATARAWFAPDLTATHLAIRRTELAILAEATSEERCRRYADVI
jgi:glutamine synthetase